MSKHISKFKSLLHFRPLRALSIALVAISLGVFAFGVLPAHSFLGTAQGSSLLYGKIADTRAWAGTTGDSLLDRAKVSINSRPPQTTYTDKQGQFWFHGLRDISYTLSVEVPQEKHKENHKPYSFVVRVNGNTSKFIDVAAEERHNLAEIDY